MIKFSKYKHGNDLLTTLCKSAAKFSDSQSLADYLNISRRSVFYVIKKVNIELSDAQLDPIVYIKNSGHFLTANTRNQLLNTYQYRTTTSKLDVVLLTTPTNIERQAIITFLSISNYQPTNTTLEELFGISKNTILSDIHAVKELLPEGLTLRNTTKGKIIVGPEILKRGWILSHISSISRVIEIPIPDETTSYTKQQLSRFEEITGSALTGNAFNDLTHFLNWYALRLRNPDYHLPINDKESKAISLSYTWAFKFLKELGVSNHSESYYLSNVVNANQFEYINQSSTMVNKLRPVAKEITRLWMLSANIKTPKNSIGKTKLVDDLTVHLIPTYYRCKYGIQYHNPLISEITHNYQETFQLTKLSISPLEKLIGSPISDDEISLITIYFGSYLRNQQNHPQHPKSILVVCSSGIGTSHLLFSQLKSAFPTVNFIKPFNTLELENVNWDGVVGIISTSPLKKVNNVPAIQVKAIPSKNDWHLIQRFLIDIGILSKENSSRINIESLLDVIAEYARIENPYQLKQALADFLLSTESLNVNYPNKEHFLGINPDFVQVFNEPLTWQKAVEKSFLPMEKTGTINSLYTSSIIRSTISHGDYMVIGNGIMLAHSKPSDGVHQLGIGFNLFQQKFTSVGNKNIDIIITLAPIDADLQVPFLQVMLKYASDLEWLTDILNTSSRKELIHKLKRDRLLSN